jgi:hypothetical protein
MNWSVAERLNSVSAHCAEAPVRTNHGVIHAVSLLICVGFLATAPAAAGQADLAETLRRVSSRVEHWYFRAQTVVSTEMVTIQPLRADMSPAEPPRRLAFDLRVAWDPAAGGGRGVPEAAVVREMLSVNGRPARQDESAGCMDPKPVSPEPLALLLPARLPESEFSLAGSGRVDSRRMLMLDYRGVAARPPDITWTGDCVTVSLPGRSRGRVWVDAETYDVLRIDDRLVGTFRFDVPREYIRRGAASSMTIERAESSIRYRRVEFQEPQETLMLPAAIDTLTVMRGTAVRRIRITQRFTDHRRFLTDSRLLY